MSRRTYAAVGNGEGPADRRVKFRVRVRKTVDQRMLLSVLLSPSAADALDCC